MSRIHEALKKAEQDRALSQTGETLLGGLDRTDVSSIGNSAVAVMPEVSSTTSMAPPSSPNAIRFENLIASCAHPTWHTDPNLNVFADPHQNSQGAEQFRTLRSRLYQLRSTQTLQTVLVTSSVPSEGKTFVATNLAQSIVRQPDRRVLLIDGDLRCARLHVPLGAPNSPGLSDYLSGKADEMAVIQHGHEGNLCFIPGGSEVSDPSELLLNGRLKTLLDRLAPVFDWVVIDSPPCLPVSDATILSNYCDGLLLVVRAGFTVTEVAQRACQELQGKNVLGVVLNAVEESHVYGAYYYQNYVYGQSESKSAAKN
jgi:protein-tyrosine kinase